MSAGSPEIGSKISVISKADIRYEGRLFAVVPQECTIALASVRSFGTEDRKAQYRVAPQTQIYDYILFRGADIKDIRVVNNEPNEPEFMQLSIPPTYQPPQVFSHSVLGSIGQSNNHYSGYGTKIVAPEMKNQPSTTTVIDCSRSTVPVSYISRKLPTIEDKPAIQPPNLRAIQSRKHNEQQQNLDNYGTSGGWINCGNMRQRGKARPGTQTMFWPAPTGTNLGLVAKQRNTLKFDSEYDFEQANTEFEEVRRQIARVKITEENSCSAPSTWITEKKDANINDQDAYYDKSKSFFDNISCEAVERSKGRSQRTDWRTERKLNTETFGASSTRRGGYRGRTGYYNRGGMYRGTYPGNYQGQQQRQANVQPNQGNATVSNQQPALNNVRQI